MTTISGSTRTSTSAVIATPVRAAVKSADQPSTVVIRPANLTAEQKAEFTQRAANNAAVVAASAKQMAEVKWRTSVEANENHQMNFANVSSLSPDRATKSIGIVQSMIDAKEDAGLTVSARYGDQPVTDLPSLKAALYDDIAKYETAVANAPGQAVAPLSRASSTAIANDPGTPGAQPAEQPRGVYFLTGKNQNYLGKPFTPTGAIKAEIDRVRGEGNKMREEMEKQLESAGIDITRKTQPTGPIYYILPQIEGLSPDGVKNVMEMTKMLSESKKDAGIPVKGHSGDKEITDLAAYRELLTDYLGKIQTAGSRLAAATNSTFQAGNVAASSYRQVRDLLEQVES